MSDKMIHLFTGRDELETHFVQQLITAQGVNCVVMGGTLGTARGELPMTQQTLPSVWVMDDDRDVATCVLNEYLESNYAGPVTRSGMEEVWVCPNCNEMVEGQFTVCWSCGAEKPQNTIG